MTSLNAPQGIASSAALAVLCDTLLDGAQYGQAGFTSAVRVALEAAPRVVRDAVALWPDAHQHKTANGTSEHTTRLVTLYAAAWRLAITCHTAAQAAERLAHATRRAANGGRDMQVLGMARAINLTAADVLAQCTVAAEQFSETYPDAMPELPGITADALYDAMREYQQLDRATAEYERSCWADKLTHAPRGARGGMPRHNAGTSPMAARRAARRAGLPMPAPHGTTPAPAMPLAVVRSAPMLATPPTVPTSTAPVTSAASVAAMRDRHIRLMCWRISLRTLRRQRREHTTPLHDVLRQRREIVRDYMNERAAR